MHCTKLEAEDKMNIVVTDAKLWQHQVQTKIYKCKEDNMKFTSSGFNLQLLRATVKNHFFFI